MKQIAAYGCFEFMLMIEKEFYTMKSITMKRVMFAGYFYDRNTHSVEHRVSSHFCSVSEQVTPLGLTGLDAKGQGFIDEVEIIGHEFIFVSMPDDTFLTYATENEEGRDYYIGEVNRSIGGVTYTITVWDARTETVKVYEDLSLDAVKEYKKDYWKPAGDKVLKTVKTETMPVKYHITYKDFYNYADTVEVITDPEKIRELTEKYSK